MRHRAFTLIELLATLAVIGLLAATLLPAVARARERARALPCLSQLRQIALAVHSYSDEASDCFPRSSHSAFVAGQLPWSRAVAGHLGSSPTGWTNLLAGVYRCASKKTTGTWSYGLNVYYELSPALDDYTGSPAVWHRRAAVPRPASTVLLAEVPGSVDHVMAHFWTSLADATDVAATRHSGRAVYVFADGHAESLTLRETYNPAASRDHWNPSLAP